MFIVFEDFYEKNIGGRSGCMYVAHTTERDGEGVIFVILRCDIDAAWIVKKSRKRFLHELLISNSPEKSNRRSLWFRMNYIQCLPVSIHVK